MSFNHENLKVYQRTLSFNARACAWSSAWDSRHSICDHLPRAATSMLENIAMASAAYSAMKIKSLDYALGSTLECAACLDLAGIKGLLDGSRVLSEKDELSQLLKMMIGLRRTWASDVVKEDRAEYDAGPERKRSEAVCDGRVQEHVLFHHETLDVYSVALEAARVFSCSTSVQSLSSAVFRRLDVLVTSMILNVAEGNGRFSVPDQERFLGTSHEAAVKLAARLDLCVTQGLLPIKAIDCLKDLLSRVAAMTSAMIRGAQE